jgi:phosphate transport system substrate-binding protein
MHNFRTILALFFLLAVVSCQPKKKDSRTDTYTSGVIPISVDESFQPIIQDELDVFEAKFPKAGIVPKFTNEVEAINDILRDSVELAIVTRPLSAKELKYMADKKFCPRNYKLATDGIALIINKQNSDSLITVDQIRRILLGDITEWKQIFPTSHLGKIITVFDNPNSSTVRFAIDSICNGKSLSKNLTALNTNPDVVKFINKTPNAIGVIGVNWLSNRKDTTNLTFNDEVRVMSVTDEATANIDNSYKPYQAYLFYGYYPLVRNLYIILNDPRGALASGLTSFLTSDIGQRIILKSGLVPATQPVRIVSVKSE